MFSTPTHTAAAAYVIAGMFDRDNQDKLAQLGTETPPGPSQSPARAHAVGRPTVRTAPSFRHDRVISRDILVGECLPVVRLGHLAALPRASAVVAIVDVRDCTDVEHGTFAGEVLRLFPSCHVLHCPGSLLRDVLLTEPEELGGNMDDVDVTMGSINGAGLGSGSSSSKKAGCVLTRPSSVVVVDVASLLCCRVASASLTCHRCCWGC